MWDGRRAQEQVGRYTSRILDVRGYGRQGKEKKDQGTKEQAQKQGQGGKIECIGNGVAKWCG